MNERDALKWLMVSRPLVPDDWWYHQQDREAWKDAVGKAEAALEAPSEMQRLVEWLEETRDCPLLVIACAADTTDKLRNPHGTDCPQSKACAWWSPKIKKTGEDVGQCVLFDMVEMLTSVALTAYDAKEQMK